MPTMSATVTIPAGGRANPFAGNQYEYLPFNASVAFALLADTGGEVEATLYSGSDVLLENSQIDELAIANPIQNPEHYNVMDVAAAGERIGCTLRNLDAANPVIVRARCIITPI